MNPREKRLLNTILALAGLFILAYAAHRVLVQPLRAIDTKTQSLRSQLAELKQEKRDFFDDEDRLKSLAAQTFADQPNVASARSGAWLTQQILAAGLSEADFTRLPIGPQKLRGAQELGWNISGSGPFNQIINLLFLLENTPVLHRIENVAFTPAEGAGRVKTTFRYLTLVIEPPQDVPFADPKPAASLGSPARKRWDVITTRNLLAPHIPPPPQPPTPAPTNPPPPSAPPPPGPETFRVVSLSLWQGQPEIHIRDTTAGQTLRYKPGDPLAGREIVMVDYRPLPRPGREWLLSNSRVILKQDTNYFALEEGATLADIYPLPHEKLPGSLAGK